MKQNFSNWEVYKSVNKQGGTSLQNNKNLNFMKSHTNMKATKVILVCLYNISGNLLTHDIYYRLFS